MDIKHRVVGCLITGAIGDAYGSVFENKGYSFEFDIQAVSKCNITDDTQLTLATCESIILSKKAKPSEIAALFCKKYKEVGIRGIGSSTLKAMRDLDSGVHWFLAGASGERSAGNGAAMRIAPIGFCRDISFEDLPNMVRDITSITHKNDEAFAGALSIATCIFVASNGGVKTDLIQVLQDVLPDTRVRDVLKTLATYRSEAIKDVAKIIGTSGYVAESVPFAIYCALKHKSQEITDVFNEIVSCGGDTDTISSMTGQIIGAFDGIPSDAELLLERIMEKEYINEVAGNFASFVEKTEMAQQKSTPNH